MLPKPPIERMWIKCPSCGAKHSIYDNTADCHGVYLRCYRGCGVEFELVIENGKQIIEGENA